METLKEKLDLITYSIKHSAFAYLFVVSNDEEVRNYFIDNISTLENVDVIDDSKIGSDVPLIDALKEKNVLLLNSDIKAEELKNINGKDDSYNSLYYRLVLKREFLWRNKKMIIVVTDEKNAISLLQENQSLASTSSFHFIDDYIKEKGITKKLTK